MSASPWADYLDARLRLVHQWADLDMELEDMARRLTPAPENLALALMTPVEPAQPGCSRAQVVEWTARVALLEAEISALEKASRPPAHGAPPRDDELLRPSHVRGLMSHRDPSKCGCRHWSPKPEAGEHHCRCAFTEQPW